MLSVYFTKSRFFYPILKRHRLCVLIVYTLAILGFLFSLLNPLEAYAAEAEKNFKFVGDKLVINIRTGKSNKHKITRAIASGTRLEVLETSEEYSRVRTKGGTEGWVLNKFLSDEPIHKHKLLAAQKRITLLEAKISQKDTHASDLNKTHNRLKQKYEKLGYTLRSLKSENDKIRRLAAGPLKLSSENKELAEVKFDLRRQNELLQAQLSGLQENDKQQWFLIGAAITLVGIFIGLLIPKVTKNRNSSWSSL